jgi:hypothetical protein
MPVAVLDGHDYLVAPTTTGVQFFDFTDPLNPADAGNLVLEGVNGGDYDNAAWMCSWVWPYLYVGGTGNGIYVVDAHDPAAPKLVTRLETGDIGGFRIGPVYGAGNFIVASGMDATPTSVSVIDAGDPQNPFLAASGKGPASMYSTVVIGDHIYGTGEGGNYSFMKWSDTKVAIIGGKAIKMGSDKGGYCTYQDGFVFCGQSSEGYRKIDVTDEANIKQVALADIPVDGADTDFATVLGNLVYLGNDHGSGAAFFAHSMAPDSTPPKLLNGYPKDGDLMQPLTSRITLFFSDEIDIDTITADNIVVRPVDGKPIDGVFSHSSFNAVSFGPKADLMADTTYEIIVSKGGLTDLAQNPIAEDTVIRFSTGDTIMQPTDMGGSGMGGGAGASAEPGGGSMAMAGTGTGGMAPVAGTTSNTAGTNLDMPPMGGGPAADEGGCGCQLPGRSGTNSAALVLGLGALVLGARVRRRRGEG